jgi:hypothetical protein
MMKIRRGNAIFESNRGMITIWVFGKTERSMQSWRVEDDPPLGILGSMTGPTVTMVLDDVRHGKMTVNEQPKRAAGGDGGER